MLLLSFGIPFVSAMLLHSAFSHTGNWQFAHLDHKLNGVIRSIKQFKGDNVIFVVQVISKSTYLYFPLDGRRQTIHTGFVFVEGPTTPGGSTSISSSGLISLVATKCLPNRSEFTTLNGRHKESVISVPSELSVFGFSGLLFPSFPWQRVFWLRFTTCDE